MAGKNENPYIRKDADGRITITSVGEALLQKIVTDAKGPVYAFTNEASPLFAAAAMARLSRRGSDLREIFLDEFAVAGEDGAEGLIDRVVTGYGDDSVQQLITVATVVESASNLLTKKIEWSRLASYLEQSTRYIYYDQKNPAGQYKYFTPQNLPAELAATYRESLDRIFDLYSEIVRGVTDHVQKKNPRRPTRPNFLRGAARHARRPATLRGRFCPRQRNRPSVSSARRRQWKAWSAACLPIRFKNQMRPAVFCSANRAK